MQVESRVIRKMIRVVVEEVWSYLALDNSFAHLTHVLLLPLDTPLAWLYNEILDNSSILWMREWKEVGYPS